MAFLNVQLEAHRSRKEARRRTEMLGTIDDRILGDIGVAWSELGMVDRHACEIRSAAKTRR